MIYNNENDVMTEYEVIIDNEKLKQVREEIIENCSVIGKHKENRSQCFEWAYYGETIRNIRRGRVVASSSRISGSDGTTIYEYTFDEYIFPDIIRIIDDILKGNDQKMQSLFETSDLDTNIEKHHNIDSLEKVVEPKRSIKEYYSELQNCFSFKKQRELTRDDLIAIKKLFGEDYLGKLSMILNYDTHIEEGITNPHVKKILPNHKYYSI